MSTTAVDPAYAAESKLPTILGVLTIFFILSFVTVVARIYTRLFITRAAGADDILIGLALICQVGAWIIILIQSQYGLGHHSSTISTDDLKVFNHASFWGNVIGIAVGTMFLKLSIAANLLRICNSRLYKIILWVLMVIIFLYELVAILFFFLNCKPLAGTWDTALEAKCASFNVIVIFGLVNTSFNIFTDVSLAIIPIPIIWNLNMKHTMRLYLIGVLSLGYLAVAMDIVKTYYQETYSITTDETYSFDLIFYGFLEDNIGLIAASAPVLKPLVGRFIGMNSSRDGYYHQYASHGNGGRSRNVRTNNTELRSVVNNRNFSRTEAGYELDDREAESDGASQVSHLKRRDSVINTVSLYPHENGSKEKILQNGAFTTTVGNSSPRVHPNFKGITRTMEVTIE